MAPMITDSYLKFSSEFGSTNQSYKQNSSTGLVGSYHFSPSTSTSNKPPLPSMSYTSDHDNFNFGLIENTSSTSRRRFTTESSVIEVLKGNNYKQQTELFDELIVQTQANNDYLINFKNTDQFLSLIGSLLINTINNEVQRNCLKFLQSYFKYLDRIKAKKKTDTNLSERFKQIDLNLNEFLLENLIQSSSSSKLQVKQISIDLIYSYMKLTENITNCFNKFIKSGIENSNSSIAKPFMDPTLCILLTEEFQNQEYLLLMKALCNQLNNPNHESAAFKCLNKIETITTNEKFNTWLNKLPANHKTNYLNSKNKIQYGGTADMTNSFGNFSNSHTNSLLNEFDTIEETSKKMKFNIINQSTVQKLSGEDEIQRLQAIKQLETTIRNLNDIKIVYPYYQDFITYMNNFLDDSNYEIRLASLKIVTVFVEKLGVNVKQCYRVLCNCARQVMSQTHQSKTMKQSLNSMLLMAIELMNNPILLLDCLLEKIKDRNAKAREEILNIVITSVLKFPNDQYASLRKIFFQVAALLVDIKRNVRHAALECLVLLYDRIKQADINATNLIEQLENISDFRNIDHQLIKDVVIYRINRNKLPSLNADITVEYGVKIPPSGSVIAGYDLDIEWIISASASSASASNMSSARSQKSFHTDVNNANNNFQKIITLNDNNMPISSGSFRRPSATKRLPWEDSNNLPKTAKSREVAPLRAFPLNDEPDFLNSLNYSVSTSNSNNNNNNNNNKNGYPSSSSYQEKYLKKIQGEQNKLSGSKQDNNDLNDISDTVKRIQSEKAFSLDNLYNLDDSINSESNVQKRKYANLNLKNGIPIPFKPTIPRRNSASRYTDLNSTTTTANNTSRGQLDFDIDLNQFSTDEFKFSSTERDGLNSNSNSNKNKYDTVPNIRNSAKNRKKLEKIFNIGANNTSTNFDSNNQANMNYSTNKSTNMRLNNKSLETNSYLSKLKSDRFNETNLNTSRYSPSNPESGIFSISDYDHNEHRLNKQNQLNNVDGKKYSSNYTDSNLNDYALNVNKNKPNGNSVTLSNKNNVDNSNSISLSNANSSSNSSSKVPPIENSPLDVVSPFSNKPKLLRSISKSKIDNSIGAVNNQLNGNSNQYSNKQQQQQQMYDFNVSNGQKQSSNDVEIVGVKLASNSNQENQAFKKKAQLKNTFNDANSAYGDANDTDMLDIVGRGYNLDAADSDHKMSDANIYDEPEFPLSLSFQTRLRQKTQEKIEEKQKRKVEKIKREKHKRELDSFNSSFINGSPDFDGKDFGLSISGYQNQQAVSGKPPIYTYPTNEQQIYSLNDPTMERRLSATSTDHYNPYSNMEFPPEAFDNGSTLPSIDKPKFKLTPATQARLKAKASTNSASSQPSADNLEKQETPKKESKKYEKSEENEYESENGAVYGVKEEFPNQPFKNPDAAFKEAMNSLAQDDWEKKCNAMNSIRRLSVYHEDLVVNNIHSIVLALLQEVKNLRSQVSRFALITFGDLFTNLKKFMDVDLDIAIKTILQKTGETNDFIRADVEKCLEKMVNNVTTNKGLIALINGGASHRNPLIRRTTARYVYKCCEIMGPGKTLSGIKDVTERVLVTASQFVVDGPADIRWYGRKIFHMLMSHNEFDRILVKYLNESTRKNIKEILDSIKVKGPGEVPTESARNSRKGLRNVEAISRSAGSNNVNPRGVGANGALYGQQQTVELPPQPPSYTSGIAKSSPSGTVRLDAQSQENIKNLCNQMRHADFRERMDAIEKFQIVCETQTDAAAANIVQIFDKFNTCLTESNSKVNYKALSTLYQITPILGDHMNAVISNVVPFVAQNLASKNSEIQDMALSVLDVFVEYLDGGVLVQPFTNLAQHGNARIKPQIIDKLADLIPFVYARKQKQVELHIIPTLWILLNSIKGNLSSNSGSSSLNNSIMKLVKMLYEQMGDQLIEKATNNSNVSSRNLEILRELISA